MTPGQDALTPLKAAITARLQERLERIRQDEEQAAIAAKAGAQAGLDRQLAEMREEHLRRIRSETERMLRKAADERQTRLWQFEREKIAGLERTIRERLQEISPDRARFDAWLQSARAQLNGDRLALEVNERWRDTLGPQAMEVRIRSMVGGAILTDLDSGRQVDGSWDWFLTAMMPEVRERWRKGVGADY